MRSYGRTWLVVIAMLVLAGCGGDDEAPQATAPPTPAQTQTEPAPTAEPTQAATQEERERDRDQQQREQGDGQTYTIRQGDTLSEIAERFDTTVRALVRENDIDDPDRIRPGQELTIP